MPSPYIKIKFERNVESAEIFQEIGVGICPLITKNANAHNTRIIFWTETTWVISLLWEGNFLECPQCFKLIVAEQRYFHFYNYNITVLRCSTFAGSWVIISVNQPLGKSQYVLRICTWFLKNGYRIWSLTNFIFQNIKWRSTYTNRNNMFLTSPLYRLI